MLWQMITNYYIERDIMIKKYQIFKETLKNVIQESGLDVGAVYFILKDVFRELETTYYTQINKEFIEEAKAKEEKEKNSKK